MAQWLIRVLVRIWSTRTSAFLNSVGYSSLQRLRELVWGEHSPPPLFVFFFLAYFILSYFILISLIFLLRFSLIFKSIFVLACFSLFCNFSCINFCNLSEILKPGLKKWQAAASRRSRKNFAITAKFSQL